MRSGCVVRVRAQHTRDVFWRPSWVNLAWLGAGLQHFFVHVGSSDDKPLCDVPGGRGAVHVTRVGVSAAGIAASY